MNDPLIARFAAACGAAGPLAVSVGLADGSPLADGRVDQPFALVGRDDACDITLSDPTVNPRHAWVQVVGGRAFAADLGSRAGLRWPDGVGSGWLDPAVPVG
ncbi:MAG: FHA domain-containing protein, partial [Gemmataceae bacterium]|nr:FHA domain-containing protein [Gemmataceae bacterium]